MIRQKIGRLLLVLVVCVWAALMAEDPVRFQDPIVIVTPLSADDQFPMSGAPTQKTNELTVLTPCYVTNLVTIVKTNILKQVQPDARLTATTNLVMRSFKLNYTSAEALAERFNNMWTGEFGALWKLSKIAQSFPKANTVIVTAPKVVVDACEQIIRDVDIETPQVYIEARFVELSNNASHKLGIDWAMLDGTTANIGIGGGIDSYNVGEGVQNYTKTTGGAQYEHTTYSLSGGTTSGTTGSFKGDSDGSISHFTGTLDFNQMQLTLKALEGSEDIRTFSNPKIIVASGTKAVVDMTTKYPNVNISAKRTTSSGNDSLDIDMKMAAIPGEDKMMFAKESFFSWGISLEVVPRVATNGVISVEIVPTISSLTDWVTLQSGDDLPASKYPQLNVQRLVTEFKMVSGTTAVIGGLSRTDEQQVDNGIPWLRDWWWIGPRLFGSKERVKEQKEIVVFVTVGLINPQNVHKDAGLPLNAVLSRQYVNEIRREPGERRHQGIQGMSSLDLRSLEEQAHDPRRTNEVENAFIRDMSRIPEGKMPSVNVKSPFLTPFTKKDE